MASDSADDGGVEPPGCGKQMCLIVRRRAKTLSPLNMTLTSNLPYNISNACINGSLPISHRSTKVLCQMCHQVFHLTHYCPCRTPETPSSPSFRYFPHSYNQHVQCTQLSAQCKANIRIINDSIRALRLSGWYYEQPLDWQGAKELLKDASVGAFLLRNSTDKNFIFSLSVQTEKGPTSVRLHFDSGYFRLDCDRSLAMYMPRFRGVVDLIQHYCREGSRGSNANAVWVDLEGCPHSQILLKQPVMKKPSRLQHLARLAIHNAIDSNPLTPKLWNAPKHRLLPLPSSLLKYLDEYPYSV